MKQGIWYKVTKGNDTFKKGDSVRLESNGDISCRGYGWVNSEAMEGIRYKIDKEFYTKLRKDLKSKLHIIEEILEQC